MPTEEQLLEIHRLALLGEEAEIAHDVGAKLAGSWLGSSRFRDVAELGTKTLQLGSNATTLNHLGRAKEVLGDRQEALRLFLDAHKAYRSLGDRAGQAVTLNNIGSIYWSTGQPEKALEYYQQALPIFEEVGDRSGEAVTRYNIAMIYRRQGKLREAVAELRKVVKLDEMVQHPDLESDRAMLAQVEQELGDN